MSDHWVEIEFWGDTSDKTFHCEAALNSLCHALYSCECESWYTEGMRDGKPFHIAQGEAEYHVGEWNIAECRYEDWFYDIDGEGLRGSVKLDVRPEWDDYGYDFHVSDVDARA